MRILFFLLFLTVTAAGLSWWFYPEAKIAKVEKRADLPWQIEVFEDGTSRVFDLHLGVATLEDAANKFGPFKEMVLFEDKQSQYALEAYFPRAMIGPLSAKIITTLAITEADIQALLSTALGRKASPSGDWKWTIPAEVAQQQMHRRLQSITFIPSYSGLGASFFGRRFGKPSNHLRIDEDSVQWFYPERGLSLFIHSDGKEVLEYSPPKAFRLPPGTLAYTSGPSD